MVVAVGGWGGWGGVPNLPSILNNWLIIKYFLIYQSQLNFNVYNWRFFFF